MPRVSEQYKEDQRAAILAAAGRCFVRNGFHRTSMQDVFREAGKSAGAVYRYFPKKDDLIVGVAGQNLDDVADVLRAALDQADGEIGAVMAHLLGAVVARHRDRQLAAMALMVWSESLRNPDLQQRLRAAFTDMSRDLAGLVRGRQRDGTWTGAAPEAVAEVIVSILPGFLLDLALRGPDRTAALPGAVRALLAGGDGSENRASASSPAPSAGGK